MARVAERQPREATRPETGRELLCKEVETTRDESKSEPPSLDEINPLKQAIKMQVLENKATPPWPLSKKLDIF